MMNDPNYVTCHRILYVQFNSLKKEEVSHDDSSGETNILPGKHVSRFLQITALKPYLILRVQMTQVVSCTIHIHRGSWLDVNL